MKKSYVVLLLMLIGFTIAEAQIKIKQSGNLYPQSGK